jgi:putative transposase
MRCRCDDHAVMESFAATVKSEAGGYFESYGADKVALFDFIEVFYNQRRRHSTPGQISPTEFERRAATQAA